MSLEETVVAFDPPRTASPRATAVRATVLLSSLRSLRARGLFTGYLARLEPRSHEAIASITAGQWLAISAAVDHYAACDALDLSRSVMREIGEESGLLLNQTVLGVLLKLSTNAGMTPWQAIGQSPRLIARTWRGTSIAVFRRGPKEARIEWIGQPCAVSGYFRVAFGGFINGLLSLFCRRSFVRENAAQCSETTVAYQCSWV